MIKTDTNLGLEWRHIWRYYLAATRAPGGVMDINVDIACISISSPNLHWPGGVCAVLAAGP